MIPSEGLNNQEMVENGEFSGFEEFLEIKAVLGYKPDEID